MRTALWRSMGMGYTAYEIAGGLLLLAGIRDCSTAGFIVVCCCSEYCIGRRFLNRIVCRRAWYGWIRIC